jgi:hypothetical protein
MATKQYSETDLSGKGSDPEQASPHISSAAGSDVDDNYNLYKQHEGEAPADSAEAKSVLRKIDWRVMPVLWTLYLLQYLDKNGLNYVCLSPNFRERIDLFSILRNTVRSIANELLLL